MGQNASIPDFYSPESETPECPTLRIRSVELCNVPRSIIREHTGPATGPGGLDIGGYRPILAFTPQFRTFIVRNPDSGMPYIPDP
jgi:hypothetical protein